MKLEQGLYLSHNNHSYPENYNLSPMILYLSHNNIETTEISQQIQLKDPKFYQMQCDFNFKWNTYFRHSSNYLSSDLASCLKFEGESYRGLNYNKKYQLTENHHLWWWMDYCGYERVHVLLQHCGCGLHFLTRLHYIKMIRRRVHISHPNDIFAMTGWTHWNIQASSLKV